MKTITAEKATRGQIRQHNLRLILRLVYHNTARNRAALALESGLTKPAVSSLVGKLMEDGYIVEEGFGESTDSGGKRPRLLRFVPEARQVVGIAIYRHEIIGVLIQLDGAVIATQTAPLADGADVEAATEVLMLVINGLCAQTTAPLLSVGIGIPAALRLVTDSNGGRPDGIWQVDDLTKTLARQFDVSVYCADLTEVAARAEYLYGKGGSYRSHATIKVSQYVGVGVVLGETDFHLGSELGHLKLIHLDNRQTTRIADLLSWQAVSRRWGELAEEHNSPLADSQDITYLQIRHGIRQGDPAALALESELVVSVARVLAWVLMILQPDHVALAGMIADLGDDFLQKVIAQTRDLVLPEMVDQTIFDLNDMPNLTAFGAAANAVQAELGLV